MIFAVALGLAVKPSAPHASVLEPPSPSLPQEARKNMAKTDVSTKNLRIMYPKNSYKKIENR
jgi:hypothetical protein